ncbi:FecR family protein [Phenylobacterium sp.]|uniref:FecR family protein n=1 Tax=Phenylobacterium sp. TaxID=1871053 RepID=UPI00286B85A5|nr:FecR family protein [Phenylobacterium sp.]
MTHRTDTTQRLLLGITLAMFATTALSAEWRLVEVAGAVRIVEPGREAAAGRLNAVLPIGTSVTTAGGARAALYNGDQRIVVGPNSRMTIAPEARNGMTRITQDLGAILFQVDKKKAPHFRVETPLLAAVVKGTTFTVVVDVQGDTVNVAEGLVEVASNAGSMRQDVPGGATASVTSDAPQAVKMSAIAASAPQSAPTVIEPLDYKAVSGGLVEAAPPPGIGGGLQQAATAAPTTDTAGPSGGSFQTVNTGSISPVSSLTVELARNTTRAAEAFGQQPGGATGAGSFTADAALAVGSANPAAGGGANAGLGNGAGNNGVGNGNGGAAVGLGLGVANGNGNGNNGNGNGNGGATVDLGQGVATGNGNGNNGNGNGNGNNGNGNGNGGATVDLGLGVGNGNGNGNNGNGNGNGNGGSQTGLGVAVGGLVDVDVTATETLGGLLGGLKRK